MFERIGSNHQQALAVGCPGNRADRSVPFIGERGDFARFQIAQHQHLPVCFVTRARHRGPSEIFAIGRGRRHRVGCAIGRRHIDGIAQRVLGFINIEIGRFRFIRISLAQREINRLAICTPVDFFAAAKGLRRCITDQGFGAVAVHVPAKAKPAIGIDVGCVYPVVIARRFPCVPVADHEAVIFASRSGAGFRCIAILFAAEPPAFAADIAPDRKSLAVGRNLEPADIGLEIARLRSFSGLYIVPPQLLGSAVVAQIIDRFAVGRKCWVIFVLAGFRSKFDRLCRRIAERQHVQVGHTLVRDHIGFA